MCASQKVQTLLTDYVESLLFFKDNKENVEGNRNYKSAEQVH